MSRVRTVRPTAVLCLLALSLLLGASLAHAGPCYECATGQSINFRDDHVLNGLPDGSASAPDVAVLGDRAFVVFVDDAVTASNPGGLEQVWAAWSSGFGCQWSQPVQLTSDNADASLAPAVAAAGDCLDVIYERAGRIHHRHASLSGFPLLTFEPEQVLSSDSLSPAAAKPDLTAIDTPGGTHLYAVWEARPGAGTSSHILFKRNLACGAAGGWSGTASASDESDLTALAGPPDFAGSNTFAPRIASDAFASPGTSAVTVAFINDNLTDNPPPAGAQSAYVLRSFDSGQSFFADSSASESLPQLVNDAPTASTHPAVTRLALAASGWLGAGAGNWSVLAWSDERATSNRDLYIDGRLEDASTVVSPFSLPDIPAETGASASREPAATAWHLPGTPVGEAVSSHIQSRKGFPEVNFRHWTLGSSAGSLVSGCTVAGSAILQLTGVNPTPRVAGQASAPAAAAGVHTGVTPVAVQFLAWVDDRSGRPEIWWKSTDPVAPGAPTGLGLSPSTCPVTGFDVSWNAPADCDISSYILSWDDGVSVKSVTVPAAPRSHLLSGLAPNRDYTIRIHAMDEACNAGPDATLMLRTPNCTAPVLVEATVPVPDDRCHVSAAPGDRDGDVEPNEIVKSVWLPIANLGSGPATAVSATIAPHPDVILGQSTSSYPDLPSGSVAVNNLAPFSFQVRSTVPCGHDIELRLDVTTAEIPSALPLSYHFLIPGSSAGCDVCDMNAFAIPVTPTFSDECSGTGTSAGNGFPDPGETLDSLKLPIRNAGTTPLTNINVVALTSSTPGVFVMVGTSTYSDVAPGTTEVNQGDFSIHLDPLLFTCAGTLPPLRLDLTITYDQALVAQTLRYNIATPDPGNCGSCQSSVCVGVPGPVSGLQAVAQGSDVVLSWPAVANARSYNVYRVTNGEPANVPLANENSTGWGGISTVCPGVNDALRTCFDLGMVTSPPALTFYQIRGVCADGTEGIAHPF